MVKFPRDNNFYLELKKEVDEFIKRNPQLKNLFILKLIVFFGLELALYALYLFADSLLMPLMAIMLGMNHVFLAMNVGHDGLHGTFYRKKMHMAIFKIPFILVGTSPYLWRITHNQSHHHNTNVNDHDFDIITQGTPVVRWTEKMALTSFSKYQHIYAPFLYCCSTLWWLFSRDFKLMRKPEIAKIEHPDTGYNEYRVMLWQKIFHVGIFLLIPILLGKGILLTILSFVLIHAVQSFIMAHTLLVAHIVEKTQVFEPAEKKMDHSWAAHQLYTTANFGTKSKLLFFLLGGLNFQVEHHLFPHVSHVYYFKMASILKKHTERVGLPYHEYERVSDAIRSHYKILWRLGKGASQA